MHDSVFWKKEKEKKNIWKPLLAMCPRFCDKTPRDIKLVPLKQQLYPGSASSSNKKDSDQSHLTLWKAGQTNSWSSSLAVCSRGLTSARAEPIKTCIQKHLANYLSLHHRSKQYRQSRWPKDTEENKWRVIDLPEICINECLILGLQSESTVLKMPLAAKSKQHLWQPCTYSSEITACADTQ